MNILLLNKQALYTRPENSLALRILSYYIVLFPTLDVISVYPLSNHVICNNLYTSEKPKYNVTGYRGSV